MNNQAGTNILAIVAMVRNSWIWNSLNLVSTEFAGRFNGSSEEKQESEINPMFWAWEGAEGGRK